MIKKCDIPVSKPKPGKRSREQTADVKIGVIHAENEISSVLTLNRDTIEQLRLLALIAHDAGMSGLYTFNVPDVTELDRESRQNINHISSPIMVRMWLPNTTVRLMPVKSRPSRTGN